MSLINKMDAGLMWFLTTLKYPKACKTPLTQFLYAVVFNVLIMFLLLSPDFIDSQIRWFSYIIILMFLLSIFYHWRLWRQLEKQRDSIIENLK